MLIILKVIPIPCPLMTDFLQIQQKKGAVYKAAPFKVLKILWSNVTIPKMYVLRIVEQDVQFHKIKA